MNKKLISGELKDALSIVELESRFELTAASVDIDRCKDTGSGKVDI